MTIMFFTKYLIIDKVVEKIQKKINFTSLGECFSDLFTYLLTRDGKQQVVTRILHALSFLVAKRALSTPSGGNFQYF